MIRRRGELGVIVFLLCTCASAAWAAAQEKPLGNAEIIRLTKLDMGDDVIIAKIKSAKEIKFDTATDDLVKLREAGVSRAVIAAMLDRLSAAAAGVPAGAGMSSSSLKVTLQTLDGSIDLKAIYGVVKTQTAVFSVTSWVQFADGSAKIRIRDRRPTILLESDKDPRGGWWFVQVSTDKEDGEDYRYFDLEGGGGFSIRWSGSPESGSVVKYEAIEEQPGRWRLTPLKELKPGEYGLFSGKTQQGEGVLFDFGIDKRE